MSEESAIDDASLPAWSGPSGPGLSGWKIGLTAMLIAIILAIVGWHNLHELDRRVARHLWPSAAGTTLLLVLCAAWHRRSLEKQAGRECFRLRSTVSMYGVSSILGNYVGGAIFVGLGVLLLWAFTTDPPPTRDHGKFEIEDYILGPLLIGGATAVGIAFAWWGRTVRVCENGILEFLLYAPYAMCQGLERHAWRRNVMLIRTTRFEVSRMRYYAAKVPAEQRAAVEAFLQAKIHPPASAGTGTPGAPPATD